MAADWEEIRRLAADFQRVQFSQAEQRLSERNCIEIVAKLLEEKKLDVVHTLDGKEFITPTHIAREIRDELYVHGGRINVVELQKIINVDLVHVENSAAEVAKSDRGTQLILGQLIDERYLTQLAEEVNDKLQEAGQVNTAELSKTYDLPGDFLTDELCARIGRVIQGQVDQYNRGVIFTQAYISRHKARIRGLFSALTRPTPISTLISAYGFQENLLYSVLEELVNSGRLKGSVVGGRQDKAVYMPDIYSRTQSAWVDSFLKQNGYLEFETLSRLGIPDPINYIKKRFKSSSLLFLKSACVGSTIVDQLEASAEEAVSSATWADLQPMLPSCLSDEDVALLLGQVMRSLHVQSSARLLGTSVVSEKFVSSCMALFDDIMQEKAKKEVNNPVLLIMEDELKQAAVLCETSSSRKDKKDERRKKASEGSGSVKAGGGGGNAREIRIRKNKKKGRREDEHDDDTTAQGRSKQAEVSFLTQDEAVEVLESGLSDCPLEMLELLAEQMLRPLTRSYQEVLRSSLASSSSSSGSAVSWRKSVRELQEELSNLYNNIRLFDKGTRLFSDETQLNISRHVLRSICTDVTNLLLNFLAAEHMMSSNDPNTITAEMRLKILGKVPEEIKAPLMKLNSSLNGKSVEEFVSCLEQAAESCDLMLKKADKKKEKQALMLHRQALLEQLRETDEPALVLHLVSVLLFQNSTHCMLHAPGRCVPAIIGTLQHRLSQEQHQLLVRYQSLVVKQLVGQAKRPDAAAQEKQQPDNDADAEGQLELHSLTREVKDLVLMPRKTSKSEE